MAITQGERDRNHERNRLKMGWASEGSEMLYVVRLF